MKIEYKKYTIQTLLSILNYKINVISLLNSFSVEIMNNIAQLPVVFGVKMETL